jgi:hypothetical protein
MANYKLKIDDFEETEYNLIAIHSSLDAYRLAYFINIHLQINLSKNKKEILIQVKEHETGFARFNFEDIENDVSWNLIQNKSQILIKKKINGLNLFENTPQDNITRTYLLPEYKKVNYLLKIDNDENRLDIQQITAVLDSINKISMVYSIDLNTIKNKNNLIF